MSSQGVTTAEVAAVRTPDVTVGLGDAGATPHDWRALTEADATGGHVIVCAAHGEFGYGYQAPGGFGEPTEEHVAAYRAKLAAEAPQDQPAQEG